MRWLIVAALLVLSAVWAHAARAESPEADYDAGWAAMDRKDYVAACELFEKSYEASRATGPLQGLAACYEARGFLRRAIDLWRSAAQILPPGSESAVAARSAIQRLEERLPAVKIRLARDAAAARVELDGEVIVADGSERFVDPVLEHVIRVTATGRQSSEVRLRLVERERRTIVVAPGAKTRDETKIGPVRGTGIVLTILGGAGLTAAAVTGSMMLADEHAIDAGCPGDRRSDCNEEALDASARAEALSPWNVAAWVVGAAATGAGIPMIVVGDDQAADVKMGLSAGPGSVSFEMAF